MYDIRYLIILGVCMLLSWIVSSRLKRKFALYSRVPMNMSGKEIAERMLSENGIHDVQVTEVPGQLTDHYHPLKKTVNLSESVYHQRTLAAAAVAAHECGHAVQHAKAYGPLKMRSALVPIVGFASKFLQFVLIAGIILLAMKNPLGMPIAIVGVCLFGATTIFALVTLPVEFDASKRALVWLDKSGIAFGQQQQMAKDALNAAAMTYVVAALASVAQLAYWIMQLLNRR
ncbi:MAG: Zn-dependent membrane protease YugP [Verrucomicrobiales bacterium]|jgi:Zn-dependent membrane protease YugP